MTDKKAASIGALMCKIQRELAVGKDEYNEFGKYKYRNAESILRAAKPLITSEGGWLAIEPETKLTEDGWLFLTVSVTLYAEDGTSFTTAYGGYVAKARKGMVEEQLAGSAYSYYLKYALQAIFALSDGDDDPDGKDNRDAPAKRPAPKKPSAKGLFWAACKELAAKTGDDAQAVSAHFMPAEATDEGFKAAEAAVRAEIAGAKDYATEDIEF